MLFSMFTITETAHFYKNIKSEVIINEHINIIILTVKLNENLAVVV